MMKQFLFLSLLLVSGTLVGCGDPAPSTPVAPEVKMPDTSKMSTEQLMKLKNAGADSGPAASRR